MVEDVTPPPTPMHARSRMVEALRRCADADCPSPSVVLDKQDVQAHLDFTQSVVTRCRNLEIMLSALVTHHGRMRVPMSALHFEAHPSFTTSVDQMTQEFIIGPKEPV